MCVHSFLSQIEAYLYQTVVEDNISITSLFNENIYFSSNPNQRFYSFEKFKM